MNLFIDYVQPLTDWLQTNPHWSLFITFLISLTESLAIIGSIVPGSVTMTAIGILAGSGIMRIDLTLIAAILGAVAGDSLSYALGYYYSDQLAEIWPFSKYPTWLQFGKDFFATHGGKSVLIGRFIGPLRSIIPVIAGILHMKQWRFFIANILSAIGWSLLYIMPGVLIGAASHELSTEAASRLFVLILLLLAGIWLLSFITKRAIKLLNSFLKLYLHKLWMKFKNNRLLSYIYNSCTPKAEKNHYPTAYLTLVTLTCMLLFIILLVLTVETNWLSFINTPTHLFFQSFHNLLLKIFFVFCTQLCAPITIISFFIICCCWFIYHKNLSAVMYLLSLIIFSSLLAIALKYSIHSPRPGGLLVVMQGSSFPAMSLEVATALYGFILFYINNTYSLFTQHIKSIVFLILGLSGLGSVYLGDYWLTDVLASYLAGATISLIHCLIYRKSHFQYKKTTQSILMISPLFLTILLSSLLSLYLNFQTQIYNHTPYFKEFTLSETTWWQQKKPILPIYQLSRIGKRISLLNIQFAGNLDYLQLVLEKNGWESHLDSFFANLLTRINKQDNSAKWPLLTQLYENKSPILFMTYIDQQSKLTLELRIWESNYNLMQLHKPLWIGSVHPSIPGHQEKNNQGFYSSLINPLNYMFKYEDLFTFKRIKLPDEMIKPTIYPTQAYIILLKESKNSNQTP